jgi:Flp pilus assembly protein TadG
MSMKFFRPFLRNQEGITAIEFAFVGPPFLLLLGAIFELGLTLTTQSLLDGAARDAARLIRTGQVQSQSSPITVFQNLLCSKVSSLISASDCATKIVFEVQVFSSFGSISFTPCTQTASQTGSGTVCTFSAGTGSNIVGVQASYPRPFIIPWVGACLSGGTCWAGLGTANGTNPGTGTVTLTSTVIFQNEPFS